MEKKKIKKKISQNKVLLVLGSILIICFILIGVALFKYFYAGSNTTKYGDRLENASEHKIHETLKKEIEDLYTDEEIKSVTLKNNGRIIYLTLDLASVVKKEDAKSLSLKSLEAFSDDEKSYYDIQYIVTCSAEEKDGSGNSLYPILGYKNSSSSVVVWTNN